MSTIPIYEQQLASVTKDWNMLVRKWKAEQAIKKQAPIIRRARVRLGIWENLFIYGVMVGTFTIMYRFAEILATR